MSKEKIYHSILEIKRDFFLRAYKEKLDEERLKEPGAFGSELAREFLEKMKQELEKMNEEGQ